MVISLKRIQQVMTIHKIQGHLAARWLIKAPCILSQWQLISYLSCGSCGNIYGLRAKACLSYLFCASHVQVISEAKHCEGWSETLLEVIMVQGSTP